MKKNDVKVGGLYTAKVSDKLVAVRIESAHSKGGWNAINTATGKRIHIKSAQRLRGAVKGATKAKAPEASELAVDSDAKDKAPAKAASKVAKPKKDSADKKPKRVSALDAAAEVLAKAGKPMRAQELITAMAEQNLWKSPGGKTPHATLYAAMLREARDKGKAARFTKVDRGMFAFHTEGN
jgi:hypothetical protein